MKLKPLFLYGLILVLFWACKNKKAEQLNLAAGYFILPEEVYFGEDSLTKVPAIPVRFHKDKLSAPIYHKLDKPIEVKNVGNAIKLGIPRKEKIALDIKKYIPGEGGIPPPRVSYSNPEIVNVKHPKPVHALAPRPKDAATMNIQYLDIDHGMNSSYVKSILEDSRGDLWFGTNGGGVSKYDGYHFTHYTTEHGLPNNRVHSIIEDRENNLWFGTEGGGIIKYNGSTFEIHNTKNGLMSDNISKMLAGLNGDIWIGTTDKGVIRYDGTLYYQYNTNNGLSNNSVTAIEEDSKGNLWFGTESGEITKFENGAFIHINQHPTSNNRGIWSIYEDSNKNLWFGSDGDALIKFDGTFLSYYSEDQGLSSNNIISIYEDSNNIMWFGSYGKGINKFDGENIIHITENEGLSLDYLWDIEEDHQGNIWVGTDGGGVSKIGHETFKIIDKNYGLSNNYVFSIFEDMKNNVWFGTYAGGINMFDGLSYFHYTEDQGMPSNYIHCITGDSLGNLWIGSDGSGAFYFDGKSILQYTTESGLINDDVRVIMEDHLGRIWFGTEGGITMYDGEFFNQFGDISILSGTSIRSIIEDQNNMIWFGTIGKGAFKYDGRFFTQYTSESGLPGNIILSIFEDSNSNIWLASEGGGVSIYDGHFFKKLSANNGLTHNSVSSILQEDINTFWLSTGNSLNRIRLESEGQYVSTFNSLDGIKSKDFFPNSAYKDSKNRFWWGGGSNLVMYDHKLAKDFRDEKNTPQIELRYIDINTQFIDFRNAPSNFKDIRFDSIARFENIPMDLKLPHYNNSLTFHFSTAERSTPHKLIYSYKMEGLNEEWTNPSTESKVDYQNLSFGEYTLMARVGNRDGVWSDPIAYQFIINPPWWFTWWAIVCYIFIFLIAVLSYNQWRIAMFLKKQRKLELEIAQATKALKSINDELLNSNNELKTQRIKLEETLNNLKQTQEKLIHSEKMASIGVLTTGMAHEINNPLNFIQGGIYGIYDHYKTKVKDQFDHIKPFIDAVDEGILRVSLIIKSLSHFSQVDNTLKEECNLCEIIDDCLVMIHNKIKYNIEVQLNYNVPVILYGNPARLQQALLNIITNAQQAITKETGTIIITTSKQEDSFLVSVKDDGVGISGDMLARITDPFYTTRNPGEGVGLGLYTATVIIREHGGIINFKSKINKGTTVLIKFDAPTEFMH